MGDFLAIARIVTFVVYIEADWGLFGGGVEVRNTECLARQWDYY